MEAVTNASPRSADPLDVAPVDATKGHAAGDTSLDSEITNDPKNSNGLPTTVFLPRSDVTNGESTLDEENDPEYRCGWCGASCRCLWSFRSPKWALALLCLSSVMQGFIVNGLLNVVISTIEKRFHLTSKESGMIRATNSVSQMICTFPVSYFGGKGRKPKYLGIGVMCIGLGAFIFSLPHFISEVYQPNPSSAYHATSSSLCSDNLALNRLKALSNYHDNKTVIGPSKSYEGHSLNSLKYFFFLGQIFHGAGSCPLWTLGVTYLDENLPTKTSSLYVGIFYAFAVLGPALGYIGGGRLLKIYTDFAAVPESDLHGLNPNHPNWVGLWWIGFVLASFVSLTVGFILFAFPAKLPGWKRIQALRINESIDVRKRSADDRRSPSPENGNGRGFARHFRPVLRDIRALSLNWPFICVTLNQTAEGFLLAIYSAFMPKFLESQFRASASDGAFFVGIIIVFCGATGMIFGGWVIKKFDMSCYSIMVAVTIATMLQLPQNFAFLSMSCDRSSFSGIDYPPNIQNTSPLLTQSCNSNCSCAGANYDPVCGTDLMMYFSPCHAGCSSADDGGIGKITYSNCSCVNNTSSAGTNASFGGAIGGGCPPDASCRNWIMYPFLLIFASLLFPMIATTSPAMQATLRTVPSELKSVALGIQLVMSRLFGAVPGPPTFGFIFDSACLLWQNEASGGRGACVVYDQKYLSLAMFSVGLIWKILSTAFILASCLFYRSYMRRSNKDDLPEQAARLTSDVPLSQQIEENEETEKVSQKVSSL